MVTCFRPRSPHLRDETVLTGVRGISDKSELYSQYLEYRLEMMEERIRLKMKEERRRQVAALPFDVADVRNWLVEQREYIDSMIGEMIEE